MGWGSFIAKTALGIGLSLVLGPAGALVTVGIGGSVAAGTAIARECVEDEDAKKALGFISDVGKAVATSGIPGGFLVAGGTGAAAYVTHEIAKNCEDEDTQKTLNFASSCLCDVAIGTAVGGTFKGAGDALGSQAKAATETLVKKTDKVIGKVAGQWAAEEIAKGGSKEFFSETARQVTKSAVSDARVVGKAVEESIKMTIKAGEKVVGQTISTGKDVAYHAIHKEKGIDYDPECPVCKEGRAA